MQGLGLLTIARSKIVILPRGAKIPNLVQIGTKNIKMQRCGDFLILTGLKIDHVLQTWHEICQFLQE